MPSVTIMIPLSFQEVPALMIRPDIHTDFSQQLKISFHPTGSQSNTLHLYRDLIGELHTGRGVVDGKIDFDHCIETLSLKITVGGTKVDSSQFSNSSFSVNITTTSSIRVSNERFQLVIKYWDKKSFFKAFHQKPDSPRTIRKCFISILKLRFFPIYWLDFYQQGLNRKPHTYRERFDWKTLLN